MLSLDLTVKSRLDVLEEEPLDVFPDDVLPEDVLPEDVLPEDVPPDVEPLERSLTAFVSALRVAVSATPVSLSF